LTTTTDRLSSDEHPPPYQPPPPASTPAEHCPVSITTTNTRRTPFSTTPPTSPAMASWNNDYCLSCDRQMSEPSAYCSQACRLADLEKAGRTQTSAQLSSSASSTSSSNNGFYLPPAVNFSAYKQPSRSKGFDVAPASPYHYYPTANGSYFAPPQAASHHRRHGHHSHQPRLRPSPASRNKQLLN
jgi:hypothetical protein